jgi:type II secretion system protein I
MEAGVLMRHRARRNGFTLVEVMLAISILGLATMGLMSATGRMIRTVSDDRVRTIASAAADARIALIRQWPTYATIDSAFEATEAATPETGWTRTTVVERVGGPADDEDYKRITVTVTGPGLPQPARRSISLAAP